jgi:alanyl-tRNA synthetase
VLVLDRTPFYGESGGQVGDTGYLSGAAVRLEVSNTSKASDQHLHHVKVLQGSVKRGDSLRPRSMRRCASARASITTPPICCSGSAPVLGEHVQQKAHWDSAPALIFPSRAWRGS